MGTKNESRKTSDPSKTSKPNETSETSEHRENSFSKPWETVHLGKLVNSVKVKPMNATHYSLVKLVKFNDCSVADIQSDFCYTVGLGRVKKQNLCIDIYII